MNKTRILLLAVLGILIVFALLTCKVDDSKNKGNVTVLGGSSSENEIIRIGVIDYPPYQFISDGSVDGPGILMIKEAFDRMEIEYEMLLYPWNRNIEMIKTGELDLILDIYYNDERAEFVDFSVTSYAAYPQHVFTSKDKAIEFDGNLESLSDKVIGINRGFYYGEKLDKLIDEGSVNIDYANNSIEGFIKLEQGRLDFFLETKYSGLSIIESENLNNVVILEEPFDMLYSKVGFSKINNLGDLIEKYDKAINDMIEDGTLQEIHELYNILEYDYKQ